MFSELRRHPRFWTLVVVSSVFLVLFATLLFVLDRTMVVAFLDVGQGDAVYIKGPNGNQILYDAGPPSGAVLRELGGIMPFWDRSIDIVVMSHPDLDHSGGIPDVLRRYHVDLLLEPGKFSGNGAYEVVEKEAELRGVDRIIARKGMRIELGDGAYADILHPESGLAEADPNNASIVLRIVFGKTQVLLSGDLGTREESRLALEFGDELRSDILKLGHHGSYTSNGPLWLAAVRPAIAVVSAGKDNRFGHPHREVLDRLAAGGIPVISTAEDGAIVFESTGVLFRRVQ